MALGRYDIPDAYTIEEARRKYSALDASARVRWLRKANATGSLPGEVLQLAAVDPNASVRQWVAKHGHFWFRDAPFEQLKADPDVLVRAAAHENPAALEGSPSFVQEPVFKDAGRFERLALMRNPLIGRELIQKVFDPMDTELGVELS
jgi:hypothetical protein